MAGSSTDAGGEFFLFFACVQNLNSLHVYHSIWGIRSIGRSLASHARGTGIEARILHCVFRVLEWLFLRN